MNYKIFQPTLFSLIAIFVIQNNALAKKYSIFDPVPKDEMRTMSTARPSKADNSYTIDSGRVQIETSLYSFDKTKTTSSQKTNHSFLNSTAFRVGLTQSSEIEFITSPIIWRKNKDHQDNSTNYQNGMGDTILRLKYNFMGNNAGNFAIAAIPFFKIATNSNNLANNYNEGGISIPIDIILKNGYSLNYNPQILILKRPDTLHYKTVVANIFVISKNLNDKLSSYVEYYHSPLPENTRRSQQTLDFGVVYAVSENITLDSAINFGLTNESNDIEMVFGGAYRF